MFVTTNGASVTSGTRQAGVSIYARGILIGLEFTHSLNENKNVLTLDDHNGVTSI